MLMKGRGFYPCTRRLDVGHGPGERNAALVAAVVALIRLLLIDTQLSSLN